MPFIALIEDTPNDWYRVDITQYSNPKNKFRKKKIKCDLCGCAMHIRHTLAVTAHFAHNPRDRGEACYYDNVSESENHRLGKREVAERLKKYSLYKGASVEYERYIDGANRIADILVTFPDGSMEVHEIQLSSITIDDIRDRTEDYKKAGIDSVVWWLGNNAKTQTNQTYIQRKWGYTATIEFYESSTMDF